MYKYLNFKADILMKGKIMSITKTKSKFGTVIYNHVYNNKNDYLIVNSVLVPSNENKTILEYAPELLNKVFK